MTIKTFDFSTLYTNIPHPKLKSRLKDLITTSFRAKSGKRRYSYIVDWMLIFVKDYTNSKTKHTKTTLSISSTFSLTIYL